MAQLASDSRFFICSGISTRNLNPIYNVPMLGKHKPQRATTTSRSIYMISPDYNLDPVIDTRSRW
jgi:hypothetical protein